MLFMAVHAALIVCLETAFLDCADRIEILGVLNKTPIDRDAKESVRKGVNV
jgi:hypothetical protein